MESFSAINIDNMGRRKLRRMKAFYSLTYDTPSQKIKGFIEGIKTKLLSLTLIPSKIIFMWSLKITKILV